MSQKTNGDVGNDEDEVDDWFDDDSNSNDGLLGRWTNKNEIKCEIIIYVNLMSCIRDCYVLIYQMLYIYC